MPEEKKGPMAFRSKAAFCQFDPEEPQPENVRPLERLQERVGMPSTYLTSARVVKGHWRRSGSGGL